MPVRKAVEGEALAKETKAAGLDMSKVRQWKDVVPEIQKMRGDGKTVPEICEALQVSYVLVNQCVVQAYKIAVDAVQVFERQEKMRLGVD
jgi:hypothetical protein